MAETNGRFETPLRRILRDLAGVGIWKNWEKLGQIWSSWRSIIDGFGGFLR